MSNQEKFSGDMSRNEVEIDLNKLMAMVTEIGEQKAHIMEMEFYTNKIAQYFLMALRLIV